MHIAIAAQPAATAWQGCVSALKIGGATALRE